MLLASAPFTAMAQGQAGIKAENLSPASSKPNDSRNATPLPSEGSGEASGEALSYAERKEQQKKIRKAQRAVDESEAKIAKLEAHKSELDELLMAPENASNMELVTEYTNLQRELDEENERWLILSEELETLNIEL